MSGNNGLPSGWTVMRLPDFCAHTPNAIKRGPFGSSLKKSFFVTRGFKVYEQQHAIQNDFALGRYFISEHMFKEFAAFAVKAGDLIISCSGTIGRIAVVPEWAEPGIINQALLKLSLDDKIIETKFFIAQFQFKHQQIISANARGSGMNNLAGVKELKQVQFVVPPLLEQRRIVAKIEELFSDLDAGVAALERAKANLNRYRAAVLKAAVEGTLTEAWRAENPNTEPASKLLERILAERRKKWEADQLANLAAAKKEPPKNWQEKYVEPSLPDTSDLPELPEGWCWASIEQCANDVTVGHVGPMKDEYVEEGVPFLRSQNVRPLCYERDGLRFVPLSFHDELKKSKLFGGELLVVRSGNIGDACVYPATEPEANCADLVITRFAEDVDAHYASIFVVSPLGQALVGGKRTGSALSHFNVGAMAKGPLPLPSFAEQSEIIRTVAEKLSQIDAAYAEIDNGLRRAGRLRQSILKQAFEGKLVPQDPSDEPASVLLERLRATQAVHQGNGKVAPPARTRGRRARVLRTEGRANE
jgi:type I restriction enzyme S subunit